MKKLTTSQLRKLYLDYFEARGHRLVKSDSLVPANDPSVLFTSAGMNQFKDHFLGRVKDFKRAASCQKCLRTGDLEEVGRTPFHHTFFEMLGNFSFGDYFKKEAIEWGWEFVTSVLEIDPAKLWVSVYEDDAEALDLWNKHMKLPLEKIKRFGAKDNFWPSDAIKAGPNGPCGPCSEIYYQKEDGGSVEVWNLVFTQFNRCDAGVLEPLPNKNIDTGMGLERMAQVLQGVDSNFKIDIFVPILDSVKKSTEVREEKLLNMIADHARAVTFCICDGVLPSNDGRGYVVRKLIRRCAYYAQSKSPKPFVYKIVSSIAESMGDQYPDLIGRRDNIAQIIKAEEEKYIKNILEGGAEKLSAVIENLKKAGRDSLPADAGLDLYVTYGIQPDFTKEFCEREGISVDLAQIDTLIKSEQEKSRVSSKMSASIFSKDAVSLKRSKFVGHELNFCESSVLQIIKDGREVQESPVSGEMAIVLDDTPFYGESGGQIGDRGIIRLKSTGAELKVVDVKKEGDSIIHSVVGPDGDGVIKAGDEVFADVDKGYREAVRRAHTATHILQAVLRKVLGEHVHQAGSYVEPDRFRFDFTHFKDISAEDMDRIQECLNELVLKNDRLSAKFMAKSEAQKTGAMALFGEKYEDTVRVVSIGDYSKEFCGGTHLEHTGQIGLVVITSEASIGSGLRRIEALTGKLAYEKARNTFDILEEAAGMLKTRPEQFLATLEQSLARYRSLEKDILKLKEGELRSEIDGIAGKARQVKDVFVVVHSFSNMDANLLRGAVDLLKAKIPQNGIFFLGSVSGENAYFVCGLTKDLVTKGLSADAVIKKILAKVSGSGGGRKDFAQGGTKEVALVDAAYKEFEDILTQGLGAIK
ncbi:MAG TPA: alanine--tRNA ligase [Candidatus Omnitrophica bacterium]|nr:alanine--tRNA ligase [Candidatus Omnitrophota bacterium]